MKVYLTLSVALILVGFVSFDSAFPQAETKETLQKDEETPSEKNPEGTRVRNPFLLPPGVYFLSKEGGGSVRKEKGKGAEAKLEEIEMSSSFKVKAILISDQIRLATIGSHIVSEGDKIDGETIFEIKSDRVILGKGDKKRTLHLRQSPVQLTIEEKQE
jgi:ribosomal protein L21